MTPHPTMPERTSPGPARSSRWARALRFVLGAAVGAGATLAAVQVMEVTSDASEVAVAVPRFVEETDTSGVDHVYDGDFRFFVGGGAAAFDCDDDGRPDLYLAGGANPAALYRNESAIGGALRFDQVADPVTDLTLVTGAYPVDIDGDGHTDLVVLRYGENVLLRGLGDCVFERANEMWAFDGGDAWTAAFSARWEPGSTLPTLAFGNYLEPTEGQHASCADNTLVRPAADGATFAQPTTLSPGWCTLSMLFSDWDRSGRRDLRVTSDRHYDREAEEQLWHVVDGAPPRLYTREDGWQHLQIWGMGIASHDLTGDGFPEVFLTSQGDNKLQTLADGSSRPSYHDIAIQRGVTVHRPHTGGDVAPSTAWHAEFQDMNNDGLIDLFVSKGNVDAMPGFAARDPSNLLLGQPDGTFTEAAATAGILSFARARGAVVADLNLDGTTDLLEVNRREPARLWRNVGAGDAGRPAPMGHWVGLRLEQADPNRDAIGAWIELRTGDRTLRREVTVGGGHAGGQRGWIHLGLGHTTDARIRVRWPDGETGPWLELPADRFATIERGAAAPRRWTPPPDTPDERPTMTG